MKDRLFIVGPGRLGLSLGWALWQCDGITEVTYCGRDPEPPDHPLFSDGIARYIHGLRQPGPEITAVFLTVPDDVLHEVAMALAGQGPAPGEIPALHVSGAVSTDILAPLHRQGYVPGCFHPLQAVADSRSGAERLKDCYWAVSGGPAVQAAARRLLTPLGGRRLAVPATQRPRYHAAAVLVSNYLPVLVSAGADLLAQAGVGADEAVQALVPLGKGTLDNVAELGPRLALTGPIVRGDLETVDLHLRTLEGRERDLYVTLGREVVRLAGDSLSPDLREAVLELFEKER